MTVRHQRVDRRRHGGDRIVYDDDPIQQRVRVRVHARHGRRPRLRLDAGCEADRGDRRRCDDEFGYSVSIDGDTMVIGARMTTTRDPQRVRVRVHARHGRRPRLRLDAGCQADRGRRRCVVTTSAHSVSIDGDTMVIGAYAMTTTRDPTVGPRTCSRATWPATSPPAGRRLPS
jgi:hypothetical protein